MLSQVERRSEGALLETLLFRGHLPHQGTHPHGNQLPGQQWCPQVRPSSQTVFSHVLISAWCLPLPSSHPLSKCFPFHDTPRTPSLSPHEPLCPPDSGSKTWTLGTPSSHPRRARSVGVQEGMSGHRSGVRAVDVQHHCLSNRGSGGVWGLGCRAAGATWRGQQSRLPTTFDTI